MFVRSLCNMVVRYVKLVGGRTSEGIIEVETAYATMFVRSRCNMVVRVGCYVELVGGRGTPEGIIEAERAYRVCLYGCAATWLSVYIVTWNEWAEESLREKL